MAEELTAREVALLMIEAEQEAKETSLVEPLLEQ